MKPVMRKNFRYFRFILLLILAAGLIAVLGLACTHNHLADQGQWHALDCPLCNILIAFAGCLPMLVLQLICIWRRVGFTRTDEFQSPALLAFCGAPRSPPGPLSLPI